MLDRCKGYYGDCELIEGRPSILCYRNALYVPIGDPHSAAGLFDCGRKLIPTGAYHRGPDLQVLGGYVTPYRYAQFHSNAGEETFFYCGHLHEHFGHFLLSSFSRYWPFIEPETLRTVRIVVHVTGGVAEFLSQRPFATELFAAIGLKPENFVSFRELTRIKNLWVVAPSFEETSLAHVTFASLGNYAGARLAQGIASKPTGRPVWLSKERLTSGVRRVVNEDEVTDELQKRGVDIAYPEMLGLPEQAALWRDRPAVGGFVGSALHTSILAPGRSIVGISDSATVVSSFPLMDLVNNAKAIYLGADESNMEEVPAEGTAFNSLKRIHNAKAFADSIVAAFDELKVG